MEETKTLENFPIRIAVLGNLVALSIYAIGAYILSGMAIWLAAFYLLYCLWAEFSVLKGSCVNCYYYGKVCGLGKGKLCSLLFKPGDPRKFIERQVSWKEIVPDMLVFLFPLAGGIALLVRGFSWLIVAMLVLLALLSFGGNAIVRGLFACKYCKQRELGCPAEKLFGGKSNGD